VWLYLRVRKNLTVRFVRKITKNGLYG